jgi:hypothetical protein
MRVMDYIERKSRERKLSLLGYTGAFYDGLVGKLGYTGEEDSCPKLLQAYKDGERYKKRFDKTSSG